MESIQLNLPLLSYSLIALWLMALTYKDMISKEIEDFLFLPLVIIFITFSPNEISTTILNIAQALGLTYILKYFLENIILNISIPQESKTLSSNKVASKQDFAIGEADIILIGILSSIFSAIEYFLFITFIILIFMLHSAFKVFIYKYENIQTNTPFIPYISISFIGINALFGFL